MAQKIEIAIRAPKENAKADDIVEMFYFAMLYTNIRVGVLQSQGKKMAEDAFHALSYEASCGNIQAIYYLGDIYLHDYLKNNKREMGIELLEKAYDSGYDNDFVALGDCYRLGQFVEQDEKKAFEIYKDNAQKGNPEGIFRMGYCYEYGLGVKEDKEKARKLYEKANTAGSLSAKAKITTDDIGQLRGDENRPWKYLLSGDVADFEVFSL
ncbi:MAG: sel1 repeat family protein [Treponema sp.]|nr:sel1 repeat family protein [Treponema sp.]